MVLLKISILSIVSLIALFILTKLMGNKEMSQLSMFDYIIGITIGSIAAELSTSLENDYKEPLLAMAIYAVAATLISFFSCKSIKFRRIIYGNSLILFNNNKFYKKNFKKAKLDTTEFLTQCRINGFFNISDIQTVILESNGKLSILPKSQKRPANPKDFNIIPSTENILFNIILDGNIMNENLQNSGNNISWLKKQLNAQNVKLKDIFLATCDANNNLNIYKYVNIQNSHEPFN